MKRKDAKALRFDPKLSTIAPTALGLSVRYFLEGQAKRAYPIVVFRSS